MDENQYQKLGVRTLIYSIVAKGEITLIIFLAALALAAVKNYFGLNDPASGFDSFLGTLILWGFLAALAALIATILISWLEYSSFHFRMDADIFKIRRGVFTKEETAIPYRRIESIDIKRNLIQQLFGVSRINIETTIDSEATADSKKDSSDEVFPAIDRILAQNIQEELTKRANVQKMQV